jgi:hypothetical protein
MTQEKPEAGTGPGHGTAVADQFDHRHREDGGLAMIRDEPGGPLAVDPPNEARPWVTRWFCDPPPVGSWFRVDPGGDEWHEITVESVGPVPCRDIHQWLPTTRTA